MSVFQTPWKLVGRSGNDFEQIIDADGNVLIDEIGYDLGMKIVKAVNHNSVLEEALSNLLKAAQSVDCGQNCTPQNCLYAAARDALKKPQE